MIFKLNGVSVNVEVSPSLSETQDESLDNARVVLEANSEKNPYAPGSSFEIILHENTPNQEKIIMYVATDNVEIFSQDPLKYKHTLTLLQNTHKLQKFLVRNSEFTQPAMRIKKSVFAHTQALGNRQTAGMPSGEFVAFVGPIWNDQSSAITKINITDGEKFGGKHYIVINNIVTIHDGMMPNNVSDVLDTVRYDLDTDTINGLNTALSHNDDLFVSDRVYFVHRLKLCGKLENDTIVTEQLNIPEDIENLPDDEVNIKCNVPYYIPKIDQFIQNNPTLKEIWIQGYEYRKYLDTGEEAWVDSYEGCYEGGTNETYYHCFPIKDESGKTFTSSIATRITLCLQTYEYSCFDILKLVLDRYVQSYVLSSTQQTKRSAPFRLDENSKTGQLLKNTIAPNFSFTQCTMYECIAEVFRLFDAVFTLDENDYLCIEYLNEQSKTPINKNFSGETRSITDERRNNGLISYYQDARTTEIYPSSTAYARATSKEYGVPDENDHVLEVPHKIDNVLELNVAVFQCQFPVRYNYTTGTSFIFAEARPATGSDLPVDVTPYLVEASVWQTLLKDAAISDYRINQQYNTLYYVKGENYINVAGTYKSSFWSLTKTIATESLKCAYARMFGCPQAYYTALTGSRFAPLPGEWSDYRFRLNYETSLDGRLKMETYNEKYPGESLIDQYNGSVDLNKMGLNMLGLSLKLGEPTLEMTHEISSWADRIKKGSIYIENGIKWVANVCTYTFITDDKIQGRISFTKNFNALAQRIRLNRERRMTNISQELTQKSEDNFVEYVYYSSAFTEGASFGVYERNSMIGDMLRAFTSEAPYLRALTSHVAQFRSETNSCYIPLSKYYAGNMFCFEMSFNHSMSAGKRTVKKSGWFGTNKLYTETINYTNEVGKVDAATINIGRSGFLYDVPNASSDDNLPYFYARTSNYIISIQNLKIYKQPNEVFALNYQLCFLPDTGREHIDFLGELFFKNFNNGEVLPKLFIFYGKNGQKYDIFEKKCLGIDICPITDVSNGAGTYSNYQELDITHSGTQPDNASCWAIGDINRNILFASNYIGDATNVRKFFYVYRANRR